MTQLNANAPCPLGANLSRRGVMVGLSGGAGTLALAGSGIGFIVPEWPGRAPASRLEKLLLERTQAHTGGLATADTLRRDAEGPLFSDIKTALLQELV